MMDEDGLKKIGFTKQEIKKIIKILETDKFYSNIDLEKVVGEKRYREMEKRIKFID